MTQLNNDPVSQVDCVKVINRRKISDAINSILDNGIEMLGKVKLEASDFAKIKVIRSISPAISSGVLMIQQETAQERNLLIKERMKSLGYFGQGEKLEQLQ